MVPLLLHEFHAEQHANFGRIGDIEIVQNYGDVEGEYRALHDAAGWLDLSPRSRLVLMGADRQKMLNGQVTNNVKDLKPGEGCYAALVNARAKMLSDLNVHALKDELLLDFEPGLTAVVQERLERFIIGEDVQVVDAAPHYGLLSVQGPAAPGVVESLRLFPSLPAAPFESIAVLDPELGELHLVHQPRTGATGLDVFAPNDQLPVLAARLMEATRQVGGRICGWEAFDIARIESGIPRYGIDMDEGTLPPEAGLTERAVSYSKGCYSGQEVIARIRTYGQVARALRGLRVEGKTEPLPARGTRLFNNGKDVGHLTSVTWSPRQQGVIALGYVRRECNALGTVLELGGSNSGTRGIIVDLPFRPGQPV